MFNASGNERRSILRTAGRLWRAALLTLVVAAGAGLAFAAVPSVVKFACVAPEGSIWVNLQKEWDRELRARSLNRARFQIFAGGILGEEIDVIRKMRAGQVHATGVTGIGMGEMVPATRVLELPRLFRTYAELDAAVRAVDSHYVDAFHKRGYVLLGFTEVGPIHLFTRKPIRRVDELNNIRMWVWEGDPVSQEISKVYKVSAVPLSLLNVLASLQTGVIDGVYGSPLAVVTMQWHNYLKYMSSEPLGYAVGVIVMDKRAFEALPADVKPVMLELGRKYTRQMVERTRLDNARAVDLMKRKGTQVIAFDGNELQRLDEKAKLVWTGLQDKLYSPQLLVQVQAAVQGTRSVQKGAMR